MSITKYGVYLGRFQPFHKGHYTVVEEAFNNVDKLIILVGSVNQFPDSRNPLTFYERTQIIHAALKDLVSRDKYVILPNPDYTYSDNKWIASVQTIVDTYVASGGGWTDRPVKHDVTLFGHKKDSSSYYLDKFPMWKFHDVEAEHDFSATTIREQVYDSPNQFNGNRPSWAVSDFHKRQVVDFLWDDERPIKEYKFLKEYKKSFEAMPFPPTFNTVDAVVVQSGHVLVVRRGGQPALGAIALPGGFLNVDETLEDSMIRELREETLLKVPEPVLRGSIKKVRTFDDPHRSQRGRTITTAFYIELGDKPKLPKVQGADDAVKAYWMPLSQVKEKRDMFMEDHYFIITKLLGV